MHVDDIGTDPVQEVLGMGHKDQDALETVKKGLKSERVTKGYTERPKKPSPPATLSEPKCPEGLQPAGTQAASFPQ